MRLAKKYAVPGELALLYEFLNSSDRRSYLEQREPHEPSDALETQAHLDTWMRERGLLKKRESITPADHRRALELRRALRAYIQRPPEARAGEQSLAEDLNRISEKFPLALRIGRHGTPELQPARHASGLGRILAEWFSLSEGGRLDRLKMCSSDECQWIFFDRSKPGTRRWCSSLRCGNRQKTRAYRERVKAHARKQHP